jgi:hypothetical protein
MKKDYDFVYMKFTDLHKIKKTNWFSNRNSPPPHAITIFTPELSDLVTNFISSSCVPYDIVSSHSNDLPLKINQSINIQLSLVNVQLNTKYSEFKFIQAFQLLINWHTRLVLLKVLMK